MAIDLQELTRRIKVGEPLVSDNLTIYSLSMDLPHPTADPAEYLLLSEALTLDSFEIGEASETGEVNTVLINNMTGVPVLILDGEEILGAKQNRMVNATVLIAAGTATKVPVSCVERGRWRYRTEKFDREGSFGYSTLRRQKTEQVANSLRFRRQFDADQSAIWQEIDRKQAAMECRSATGALYEVYENLEEKIAALVDRITPAPGQIGHIVLINNRFTCLDLFDQPATLDKLWPKLAKSYAVEALEAKQQKMRSAKSDPHAILKTIADGDLIAYPSVGLGLDLRLTGTGIIGSGLALDDKLVHLSVFGRKPNENSRRDGFNPADFQAT